MDLSQALSEFCDEIMAGFEHRSKLKSVLYELKWTHRTYLKLGQFGSQSIKEFHEVLLCDINPGQYECFSWRFTKLPGVKKCLCIYCKREVAHQREIRHRQAVINACSHLPLITLNSTDPDFGLFPQFGNLLDFPAQPELSLEPETNWIEFNEDLCALNGLRSQNEWLDNLPELAVEADAYIDVNAFEVETDEGSYSLSSSHSDDSAFFSWPISQIITISPSPSNYE